MRKRGPRAGLSVALAVAVLVITSPAGSIASPGDAQEVPGIFVPAPESGTLDRAAQPAAVRSRLVQVNTALLEGSVPRRLTLNLFDDLVLHALLEEVDELADTGRVWRGRVDGQALSQVILVQRGGLLAGDVFLPGAVYQVRPAGDGLHAVVELDPSAYPPELEPVAVPPAPEAAIREALPLVPADDGSVIDVLVVYTPQARTEAGGTASMLALVDLAVAETNASYANSQVSQRLHLVRAFEVSYVESGTMGDPGDLRYLRTTDDGVLDSVHTLRDTYGADAVVLIVHYSQPEYCGVAYQLAASVEGYFDLYAFAVVELICATGNLSFGHELGHNMGANHDWYVNASLDRFTYSHGYFNTADRWRTIMSYDNVCAAAGVSCTRIPYWSNPYVTYGGDPMGIPGGTSLNCVAYQTAEPACDADNRRTLNETAYRVANFRPSVSGPPAAPSALSAAAVSSSQINLAWSDNSADELGFRIEHSLDGYAWVELGTVPARVTSYANNGLVPGVDHFYRVRAYNLYGNSAYSEVAWTHIPLVGPLVLYGTFVDDDNSNGTAGDGDGRLDCGETVALKVGLRNLGTDGATGVMATLSETDPDVSIVDGTPVSYGTIPATGVVNNLDDLRLQVVPGLPWGESASLRLDVTAGNGGPWQVTWQLPIECGSAPQTLLLPALSSPRLTWSYDSPFNGSAAGWQPHSGAWWVEGGQWYTTGGLAGAWSTSSYAADLVDLDYQVELARAGCDICAHGILIRGSPAPLGSGYRWNSGYGFYIRRSGDFAVFRYDGGSFALLQTYTPSAAILQGSSWNRLRVVASGSSLTFYVNDIPIWSGTDGLYPGGRVGLAMYGGPVGTDDRLWVNWATISPPVSSLRAEVSPEQQLLNRRASEDSPGIDDTGAGAR